MTIYIGYDKDNNEVIRSIYKDLVRSHIAVVLIVNENENVTNKESIKKKEK